ncbi:sterile alpha motif domain-containing protein 3-like isoform X2 [Paramormyrops kingsleyae]|uniref:sterile alpha motif domain-containing protein 3-like isoform X2 n=2 Tax=Paramormyrops kingsleyae TaxID=1676925 RepID=UPI003B96FB75
MMTEYWTVEDVCKWLQSINLIDAKEIFIEQQIDGETLLGLTERMTEKLFPLMKQQVIFLKELEKLRNTSSLAQQTSPMLCDGLPAEPSSHQGAQESWPALYTLPVLPPELQEALQRKDPSFKKKDKSHVRSLLIQVLFDNITKYTWYPNHKKYTDVLGCLITRFPFLRDHSSSGYETLLECLRNKFKKERSPLVNLATVQEMKKKFGAKRRRVMDHVPLEDPLGHQRAKRHRSEYTIQTSWGDCNPTQKIVLDHDGVGEDDLSFREHINAMNNELCRRQPDFPNIMDRMKRTLYKRVEYMAKPTEEVMEMFPFLQVPELMHHEMRLRFGQDMELSLQNALSLLTSNIIRAAQHGSQKELLSSLLRTEANTDNLQKSVAILILPALFKENSKFLYCLNEEPPSSFPTIILHDSETPLLASRASIKMDEVTITSGKMDIPHALQCLLEVYFIFGVQYPKQIKHTLSFAERYLFQMANGQKPVSIPVLKLYNQICS